MNGVLNVLYKKKETLEMKWVFKLIDLLNVHKGNNVTRMTSTDGVLLDFLLALSR